VLRSPDHRPAVTLRCVLLGLLGVVIICGLTPFNDYAMNNSTFVGFNLPVGLMTLTLAFIVLVNGPLSRFAPRHAFSGGELAVAFSMALVSCAFPSAGLMRFFPGALIGPYRLAMSRSDLRPVLEAVRLPEWILPTFSDDSFIGRANDPLITGFYERWIGFEGPPPYLAWLTPALTWGVLFVAMFGTLLFLLVIVRRQWMENERLSFPLAQIQLSLIAPPARGRWLNATLHQRGFWISLLAVLIVWMWNGVAVYWPKYVPTIPMGFNLVSLMTDAPLNFTDEWFQKASIYLTAVGVTFFLPSHVSFSLWFFYVLYQVYRMAMGSATGDVGVQGALDEHLGAVVAFALATIWIGRNHWRLVIAQALRGARPGEPRGTYLSYPTAAWGLLVCVIVMAGWLVLAGASVIGAAVVVILLLMLFMVITRVIAETGLLYGQLLVPLYKPFQWLTHYDWPKAVSLETFYLGGMLNATFYDFREPMPVYASHAMKLNDQLSLTDSDETRRRSTGRKIIGALALAMLVGYGVSFASMLWTEYRFNQTLDDSPVMPLNAWGTSGAASTYLVTPAANHHTGRSNITHNPIGHAAGGFAIATILQIMRLRFAWWPLHPVGFLMLPTTPIDMLWFSICLGWLCKTFVLRLGGARVYQRAMPWFLGIIMGECLAAGAWITISIILAAAGIPYRSIQIMPI
jgi:hypothetical protein